MSAFRPPQRGAGGTGRTPTPHPEPGLPAGYLQRGYFDDKGHLLPQVVQDWPREIALGLPRAKMTTAQLRGRFFAEVRRLEKKLEVLGDFEAVKPEVLKLKAFAEDAAKKNKVPFLFREFIERNVHWAARGKKEFKGFINHFECVVAYFPEVRGR